MSVSTMQATVISIFWVSSREGVVQGVSASQAQLKGRSMDAHIFSEGRAAQRRQALPGTIDGVFSVSD